MDWKVNRCAALLLGVPTKKAGLALLAALAKPSSPALDTKPLAP